ncbi:hypothetical protein HPB50_023267 [Hyalomma asiaticum]|uniref:Uncharacterized protein n=1 Tax=Hyalomma asiaticum TaxID=266040 RepID=A0ACB7SIF0_HYAAI|nr:hypothetical protein HPB50_023267 [Hyalomma asiaticum]
MDFENKECLRARQSGSYLALFCDLANPSHKVHFGAVSAHCCAHANESSWQPLSSITLDVNGVGYELLVMLMEAVVLFCVLAYWDSGHRCARVFGATLGAASAKASPSSPDTLDEDVRHEHEEVVRLRRDKLFQERALLVENLHKKYGSLHAVRGLTFGVHQQECFGLLGVNGSGKTTTFQMLTALVPPTRGEAYMGDYVLSREPRLWQARLGYCMQYGGLLESLTAYEFLRLFARLRGVPSKDAKPLVESFVELVGLQACADRPCGTYSGGGKRKLSMAAALIGLPRLVFLDEPTAGVDVVAKTRIFAALADIMSYSGISIVLNSHSMDDCESVCDRIAIMSKGQMQCLGTLQRLKDRFGGGYTLVLKLTPKERVREKDVQVSIQQVFLGAALKDYREGVFKFHLLQKLRWSEVFARVNELQKCYSFEYAFVSDCSLEDIFVDIARRPTSSIALKGTSK